MAVRITALRGQAMADLQLKDLGAMVAIATGPDGAEKLLAPFGASLAISNYNLPKRQ